jgi:hypothetical protein
MELRTALWNLLGFGVFPLWLAAGGADWLCHRRTHIERTSGPRESLLHLLLFLEIAIPAVLALWLEINALMLALMAAGVLAHMLTSWWDTAFAQPRRYIAPIEQHVHSWLEMLPLFALVMIALLHASQLAELRWQLTAREHPVAPAWRWAVLLGLTAGLAFILEEGWRGLRERQRGVREPPDPSAVPRP